MEVLQFMTITELHQLYSRVYKTMADYNKGGGADPFGWMDEPTMITNGFGSEVATLKGIRAELKLRSEMDAEGYGG